MGLHPGKAIVVGSGAGGCMAARELALKGLAVTVVEAGRDFSPLTLNLNRLEAARKKGLFFNEQLIQLLFPYMRVDKAPNGLVHVRGNGVGGTTALATGNALRYDRYLKELGINLDAEFEELSHEVPQTTAHRARWSELTELLFQTFEKLGLNPQVSPKFLVDPSRCVACGRCVLGCRYGAKWTADKLIRDLEGVEIVPRMRARKVLIKDGRATGVVAYHGTKRHVLGADLVILAAGGLGTPPILTASGIPTSATLFVDPVLCIAAPWEGAKLDRQMPMPFISQQEGYIISPYFDWMSFYFNPEWRQPSSDMLSIMIKMADCSRGSFDGSRLDKPFLDEDFQVLNRAVPQVHQIFEELGIEREDTFWGTINAGHPGGCFPLTKAEATTLHHKILPANLYLADPSLFPRSMGNPPILTIMALAKRVARMAASI
ncbi:MAG: GMC family oxidoreductase N-terminal domain-containing protein [Coriobacteriales bacterium]|nr:GMC family oxidoreductase N-terminal domain-containing protein [Coriobacteriales bacterium]